MPDVLLDVENHTYFQQLMMYRRKELESLDQAYIPEPFESSTPFQWRINAKLQDEEAELLFEENLEPEERIRQVRAYIRLCTALIMRFADPADPLIVEGLKTLGAPLTLYCVTNPEGMTETWWNGGEPSEEIADVLRAAGVSYTPGQHSMSYEDFTRGIAKKRRRWQGRQRFEPRRECAMAVSCGIWLVTPVDDFWPNHLQDLGDETPYGLWGKGDPAKLRILTEYFQKCVAVVGSRDASVYGADATSYLVHELAQKSHIIISGGAYGIDVAAHRAALAAGSSAVPTIALMAGGLDHFYPVQNSEILHRIVEEGLILSEVSIGNTPTRWRFLERNRLIAALSHDVVVVEARWRSGALNTARHGLEIGRELWAVPGNINSPNSVGCHRLIRDGYARILSEIQDILEAREGFDALQEEKQSHDHEQSTVLDTMSEAQGRLWDMMSPRTYRSAEELAGHIGLPLRGTMVELSQLAQQGLAETDGFGWRKIRQEARSAS